MWSLSRKIFHRAGGGTVRPTHLTSDTAAATVSAAAAAGADQGFSDSSLCQNTAPLSRAQSPTVSTTVLGPEVVLRQAGSGH